ncbi:MAG: hypothetical protein QOJ59_4633 [Thermomicrobiales bacterium]|jgi:hypothetical protein|nr:hypothetical protein [Thermomicrobiales bacterium]
MSSWRDGLRLPITDVADAAPFVEKLGFCTWAPVSGLGFPNLAEAMGETAWSVMVQTWFWKDDVHLEKRLYYAKIVRGQPSFIAPEFLPDFVAALGGRGREAERDPARLYLDGRLSREAKVVFDCLTDHPALSTGELRRRAGLAGKGATAAAERALLELQRRLLICKVDLTGRTRGTYSYVWDLAERFWPEEFAEARRTSVTAARANIRERLRAFGIEPTAALEARLFLWR